MKYGSRAWPDAPILLAVLAAGLLIIQTRFTGRRIGGALLVGMAGPLVINAVSHVWVLRDIDDPGFGFWLRPAAMIGIAIAALCGTPLLGRQNGVSWRRSGLTPAFAVVGLTLTIVYSVAHVGAGYFPDWVSILLMFGTIALALGSVLAAAGLRPRSVGASLLGGWVIVALAEALGMQLTFSGILRQYLDVNVYVWTAASLGLVVLVAAIALVGADHEPAATEAAGSFISDFPPTAPFGERSG